MELNKYNYTKFVQIYLFNSILHLRLYKVDLCLPQFHLLFVAGQLEHLRNYFYSLACTKDNNDNGTDVLQWGAGSDQEEDAMMITALRIEMLDGVDDDWDDFQWKGRWLWAVRKFWSELLLAASSPFSILMLILEPWVPRCNPKLLSRGESWLRSFSGTASVY